MNAEDALPPILVADDSATDVFFLQRRLAAAGVTNPLEHVEDGQAAIRWLEARLASSSPEFSRPWLVFVDLKMPCRDGFEVLAWLGMQPAGARITVTVLSTSDEPNDMERARRLGAYRYLVKYPKASDLRAIVDRARLHAFGRDEPGLPLSAGGGAWPVQG